MTAPMPDYSDAAKAFADTKGPRKTSNHRWFDWAEGFDAGAANATVRAEPITTAADLDALAGGRVVLGDDGFAFQKNAHEDVWYLGFSERRFTSADLVEYAAPLTLLAPASPPVPEPVLLTADDPRRRDGAKVRGEYEDNNSSAVEGVLQVIFSGADVVTFNGGRRYDEVSKFARVYLLAEAPDPDADKRQAIIEVLVEIGIDIEDAEDDAPVVLTGLRERGVVAK